MKTWLILKKELLTLRRNRIKFLCLLVAIMMPLAYGFLYLWAFWDPYDNMKDIPVAVVNEDKGAVFNGLHVNFSSAIVDKLKSDKVLHWEFVNYWEAKEGLDDQHYYAIIRIPEDFSANLVSINGDDPRQAQIAWETKDSTSFLFTTYFKAVTAELQKGISSEVIAAYQQAATSRLGTLTGKIDEAVNGAQTLAGGLGDLEDGSVKLADNLETAHSGSVDLVNGLGTLNSKSVELVNGLQKTKEGAAVLKTGIDSASSGAKTLDDGMSRLEGGADELSDGAQKLYAGSNTLSRGTAKMDDEIGALDQALVPLSPSIDQVDNLLRDFNASRYTPIDIPDYIDYAVDKEQELVDGQWQIADGAQTLSDNMATLNNGAGQLSSGVSTARQGASSLSSGLDKINAGSGDLYNGLSQLYDGGQQFSSGVNQAYNGGSRLSDGLSQLSSGGRELSSGIQKAKNGADLFASKLEDASGEVKSKLTDDQVEKMIVSVHEPVSFENKSVDNAETYGVGFVPYFLPMALWMGALMITLLFHVKDQTLVVNNVSRHAIAAGKFLLFLLIGVVQALVLAGSLMIGLGLHVKYLLPFLLFCICISLCFIAIMQFFAFSMGKVGELVGIILLMLQLTSSSGTFPVQSAPVFFRIFNPISPMNYAIKGLRLLVLGGASGLILRQFAVLILIMALFLSLKTLLTKKYVAATDLYPLIEL